MDMTQNVICTGIKSAKGDFKDPSGREVAYDSTTFYLNVDLGQGENTIGQVAAPFKFGTSEEFNKWKKLGENWPQGGLMVEATFGMQMSGGKPTILLKDIRPASQAPRKTV